MLFKILPIPIFDNLFFSRSNFNEESEVKADKS